MEALRAAARKPETTLASIHPYDNSPRKEQRVQGQITRKTPKVTRPKAIRGRANVKIPKAKPSLPNNRKASGPRDTTGDSGQVQYKASRGQLRRILGKALYSM